MKVICTAVLAATLLFSGCGLINKTVGYDIGACSPDRFVAAHIEYTKKKTIIFTEFQTGPTKHFKPGQPIVYEYVSTDEQGEHYGYKNLVLVIKDTSKGKITGEFLRDDEVVAIVFGVAGDGTQLSKNANLEVQVCQSLNGTLNSDAPAPDSRAKAQ